jgi:hypothetical protein
MGWLHSGRIAQHGYSNPAARLRKAVGPIVKIGRALVASVGEPNAAMYLADGHKVTGNVRQSLGFMLARASRLGFPLA